MLTAGLFLFLAIAPSTIAQTSQLILRFPDGTATGIGNTCFENQACEVPSESITAVCTQEGTYSLLFTSHLPDSSTNKFPELDAHTVNWNEQQYCTSACTGQNIAYSSTAKFCCGAHRAGDCAFKYGNELCVDTSANTWEWGNLANNIGDIFEPLCVKASYVSDGTKFYACGDTTLGKTPLDKAERLTITRTGRPPHDYVCAKLKPDDTESLKTWIECHGNDDILTRKQGKTAETGVNIGFGLIFAKKLTASETLELKKELSFSTGKGTIEFTIKPSWSGNDGLSHTFFQYTIDDNNYLKILKQSDGNFACIWRNAGTNHNPEGISIAAWKPGELHRAKMTIDITSGKITCTLDGTSKEAGGAGAIAAGGTATINSGPLGAVPGKAELNIKISDTLNPSTLYCTQTSRLKSDLDIGEKAACDAARLTWTGSKCCSEDDDPNEFYNDPDPRSSAPTGTGATSDQVGSSTGGSGTGTGGTTTSGSASEGVSYGTGSAIYSTPKIILPGSNRKGYTSTGAFIAVTGMDTTSGTTATTTITPICPIPAPTPLTCPTVTPSDQSTCPLGTIVPALDSTGCPTGQYTCSPWKPSSPGGCWNSTYIRNGQAMPGTNDKIISVQGRMLACLLSGTSSTSAPTGDTALFDIKDKHTGAQLVTEITPCTLAVNLFGIEKNNKYCSLRTKNWQQTDLYAKRAASADPINVSNQECCPTGMCWSGERCVDNQRCDSTLTTTKGYRCIDGSWTTQNPLWTPSRKDRGYCPTNTMCLVNPSGKIENVDKPMAFFTQDPSSQPTCINQTQYILNNVCHMKAGASGAGSQKTEWKSRASLIALQLAEVGQAASGSSPNYAIFCGNYEDVLNFVDYESTVGQGNIRSYLNTPCLINDVQAPCVNTFCAMRFSDNKVAFGTSTNVPISDSQKSFLVALGKSASKCAGAMQEDGAYHSCGDGIFYNNLTASLIVVPTGTSVSVKTTDQLISVTQPLIVTPRKQLLSSFMERATLSKRKAFFDQTTLLGEIFILKSTGKNYFGMLERDQFNETFVDYIGLIYEGFPVVDPVTGKKPCDMIRDKIPSTDPGLLENDCDDTTTNTLKYVAFAKSPQSAEQSLLRQFWKDLTAKLR